MTRLLTGLFSAEAFPAPRWAYLGRGLYLAWYMAVMLAEPPLLPAFSTQDALVAHRLVFFASYLAMCVVFAALWRRLSPLRTHRAVLAASTAVGLSGVVVYLLVMWGILPQGAMSVGFVCAAVALPILDIGWGEAYSYLPLRSIVAMLVVSVAICMALVAVTPAVPAWLGAVLLLAQTAASSGLLIFALARSPYRSYREPAGDERARMLPSRSFLLGVALLVCAAYLINAASESVEGSGYLSLPGTVLSIAVAVAFLVATALHPDRDPARFLAYIGLFEAAAFLVLGLAGAQGALGATASALILSCATCVGFTAWFVVIDAAQTTKTSPYLACSAGLVAIALGKAAAEAASVMEPHVLSIAVVALGLLCFGVYFAATSRRPEAVELPVENTLEARAGALADAYGLTPREREVLLEWASGHNAAYVADTLSISLSTAKTHIAHISQKTGTHGREELLRLLDGITPGSRRS